MELTIEELQEILNEEHQETQRNVSPSEQEEDEREPMPTSAVKDLFKKGDTVRAMVLEWHPSQADVSRELWFQQDGATCHTARATIDLLKYTLGDRLISRFGPVNWPPRSCDLTPLDYFLWGYVMSLVYADKPQTLDNLEDNIRRVIADIRPQMLEKVIENWTSRLDYIRASRGSHMPEITFKM
ncbi:transposable element Tc3 transposase [Trichonephila clavipes]|nr:transposable element Tc3 transposase [Trichonephila clavipes]